MKYIEIYHEKAASRAASSVIGGAALSMVEHERHQVSVYGKASAAAALRLIWLIGLHYSF